MSGLKATKEQTERIAAEGRHRQAVQRLHDWHCSYSRWYAVGRDFGKPEPVCDCGASMPPVSAPEQAP